MSVQQPARQTPIAVVGISALMPGSTDVAGFWRNIVQGEDLITDVPPDRWLVEDYYDPDMFAADKTYCRRGAFLGEFDFDSIAHGIPPVTLASTDTSQLLALIAADAALADATGGHIDSLDRERVGVILGVAGLALGGEMVSRLSKPLLINALREQGLAESQVQQAWDRLVAIAPPWRESTFPGLLDNVVAGRIANRFDLHGTNFTTDAACASSLAALSMAIDELVLGRADLMLTGGVDTLNEIFAFMCFSKTPALSLTGDCRPFSDAADGTMLGEGLVMFALKRLADAESDGDRIYAVITGVGSSSDGKGSSIFAPVATGQARALRRAYAVAGHGPDTVELVEAHGTGTIAGDAAEFEALREVFDATGRSDRQWCALGSVKSQYGHTKATAGAVGLLKAVLALHHKVLPPTIKVERPDARLDLAASPMYLNTRSRPWIAGPDHPRRAGVSSFGFGGTNFHITLQEYVPTPDGGGRHPWRSRAVPNELFLLSADTPQALVRQAERFTAGRAFADLARASQRDFDAGQPARLAVVAADAEELGEKLDRAIAQVQADPDTSFATPTGMYYGAGAPKTGGIAFLFPGQGSQYPGMGADLAMHLGLAQRLWDRSEQALPGLRDVVFPIPVFTDADRAAQTERLTATEWAQPALAVHSLVLLDLLHALGLRPDSVAGHSFGELTALSAAGAYDGRALLQLARRRGELMREAAAASGGMIAILASGDVVAAAIAEDDGLWLANHNGPGEYIVSGTDDAIAALRARLAADRITARPLNTAAAFHSPLVASARPPLAEHLAGVQVCSPDVQVYGNADAAPYPTEPEEIRRRVATHLATPVRWAETIEAMYAAGVRTFVEIGAGATLTGLVSRILGDAEHTVICTDRPGVHGITSLHQALGRLAASGVPLNFEPLWESHRPLEADPAADETARPPKMITKISGRNLGMSYPPAGGAAALAPPNPEPKSDPRPAPAAAQADPLTADTGLLEMIRQAQQQTAEAHAAYQQAMADSHIAYLKMTEASMEALSAMVNGGTLPALRTNGFMPPTHEIAALEGSMPAITTSAAGPVGIPTGSALNGSPVPGISADLGIGGLSSISTDLADVDVEALILSIVADKTGYPVDMIGMDMDIDIDLGIDSIKRVEILAALRAELPWLPEVSEINAPQLAELMTVHTIGDVVARTRAELDAIADGTSALIALPPSNPSDGPGTARLSMEDLTALARKVGAGHTAPTTPADRTTTAPQLPPARNGVGLARMAVRPSPASPVGLAMPGLFGAPLAVTDDGAGVAQALVRRLIELGVNAHVVSAVPAHPGGVLLLDGLREVTSADEAIAVQRAAFHAARTVAPDLTADGGIFVTVQDTGGDFGLRGERRDRAWLGGLAALARTAAREWPRASVKAIDCERAGRDAESIAEVIAEELCTGGPEPEVGLRADGTRLTLDCVAVDPRPSPAVALGPDPVILVSGGARGVTAAAIRTLALEYRPRLVLLGRTPLTGEPPGYHEATTEAALTRLLAEEPQTDFRDVSPLQLRAQARAMLAAREVRQTLAELDAAGVDARYLAVDVTDGPALEKALAEVRRDWGPIAGLIHGAGVLADRLIADKTDEDFDAVFDTKVSGLRNLLTATAEDPLRLLCAFSSIVARFGNIGQCDYAMANETLNQVLCAEAFRRPDCVVRSLMWGPWQGGMVTEGLAGLFQQAGVPLIDVAEGARAFTAEFADTTTDTQVLLTTSGALDALAGPGMTPPAARLPFTEPDGYLVTSTGTMQASLR